MPGAAVTTEELGQLIQDAAAALERIADALEALELLLRMVAQQEGLS